MSQDKASLAQTLTKVTHSETFGTLNNFPESNMLACQPDTCLPTIAKLQECSV